MEASPKLGASPEHQQDLAAAAVLASFLRGDVQDTAVSEAVFARAAERPVHVIGAALLTDGMRLGGADVSQRYAKVREHVVRLQYETETAGANAEHAQRNN